jgi:hypothetical protein
MTALPRFSESRCYTKNQSAEDYNLRVQPSPVTSALPCVPVSSVVQGFEIADDTGTQGLSSIMLALSQKKPIRTSEELA